MRINFLASFSILSLSWWGLSAAVAQEQTPIERIEITGEQSGENANYTIINRSDFIDKAQTLGDLLNQVNGIQIRQISGLGNPAAVSIRGSSSKQVQLYIDGQLVNDSQFGDFDLNQIPVENIQSIELSKDQAIGTGATPIGGVIRINTYNPSKETLRISAGLGSFGTRELNLVNNRVIGNGNVSIAASHLASDNDYDFLVEQPVNNPGNPQVEALRNNQFEKNTLAVNAEFHLSQHQFRINGQYSDQEKALPQYQNNTATNRSSLEGETTRVGANYLYQPASQWLEQLEVESYFDSTQEQYLNSNDGISVQLGHYDTDKTNLSLKPTLNFNGLTVTPFVELNLQEFTSKTTYNGEIRTCNGISACDVKADKEQWVWGSRFDWRDTDAPLSAHALVSQLVDRSDNIILNQTNGERVSNDSDFVTGELGLAYDWNKFSFSGALSHGVRMPTLYELYGDRGLLKGNADLEPEESDALSISIDYTAANWSMTSSVYYKQVERAIVATFNSSGVGSYGNISDANIAGLEWQADYQFNQDLTFYGQINLVDSASKSVFSAFNNKKVPGIYHQEFSAKVSYDINTKWSVNLNTQYSKGLYFNLANKVEQNSQGNGNPSDRWLTDLQASWQHKTYALSIGVTNLLDEEYRDLANRSAQGRSLLIKFSYQE